MIGLARARLLLSPHYERLYRVVTEAFAESRSVADTKPYIDATTIANIAHDAMCDIARREFEGVGVDFATAAKPRRDGSRSNRRRSSISHRRFFENELRAEFELKNRPVTTSASN
jgi:hypothetical protein